MKIAKYIRATLSIIGALLIYCGVSTADFYILELGQTEPARCWWMIGVGFLFIVPAIVRGIRQALKEGGAL